MPVQACLSSPIFWTCRLRQAVWVAGLSLTRQCTVTHHCGSIGLMRSSNRLNKDFVRKRKKGKRKTRRKRIQVAGRDVRQHKILDKGFYLA